MHKTSNRESWKTNIRDAKDEEIELKIKIEQASKRKTKGQVKER